MVNILSIDGGGIKGVYAISVLAKLEELSLEKLGGERKRICDYFDLIAGTSTGAIIAAGLALGISAEEIQNIYMERGKEIFSHPKFPILTSKYKTEGLKHVLKEVFKDSRIGDCKTRLLIPTVNISKNKIRVIKTAHHEDYREDYKCKIVEALLKTTAAPTYFRPYIGDRGAYIDGGVGANNPSLIAFVEGITSCGWKFEEIRLLSIGCTENLLSKTSGKEKFGLIDAPRLINTFMWTESEHVENIINLLFKYKSNVNNYIRINYKHNQKDIRLDNTKKETLELLKKVGIDDGVCCYNKVKGFFEGSKHEFKPVYVFSEK